MLPGVFGMLVQFVQFFAHVVGLQVLAHGIRSFGQTLPLRLSCLQSLRHYENKPGCLFSHHFNDHSFVALAVEFGVEDLLPWAEVKFAAGDRDDDFVVNDQRFKVSVSVIFSRLVMLVVLAGREPAFPATGRCP